MLLFIKRKVPDVEFITAKNSASKVNGSWKNYSKEKTAITFGEECSSSSPGQNGRRFADDIFICILVNDFFIYFD